MQSSSPFKIWPLLLLSVHPAKAQEVAPPAVAPPAVAPIPIIASAISVEPEIALDELIRRALRSNPQLPIARQTEEAARQRVGAARSFPGPTLELVPRLIGNRQAADEEVILSQPLDVFGRRSARAGVAAAQLRAAQSQSVLAERSLVVAVKNAAAELFAAQEAESLGSVQVEVAQLFRDAAARRAELGDVPPVQVARAELELLRVQNELATAQAERLVRRAVLNQLVGQAPETPLRVALPMVSGLTEMLRVRPGFSSGAAATGRTLADNSGATPGAAPGATPGAANANSTRSDSGLSSVASSSQVGGNLVESRGQVLPDALANRPDIVGAQATLEARRAQVKVLMRERLPQIELQARRSSFTRSGTGSGTALRAVITIPVFDFGSNKRERRALEAEARAQESTIVLLRSQVAVQVEQALIRLEQQRATVLRYQTGILPLTLDLLRKTQIGYAQGASTYLEVLEAQRTLRQVQTEYLQALVGTRTQEALLESALGASLPISLAAPILNPSGPIAPPGVAAPGTVPQGAISPNLVAPLQPPFAPPQIAPPPDAVPTIPATPDTTPNEGMAPNN